MTSKEIFTVGSEDFEVIITELKQSELKFYTKNPRVYSILNINGNEPTQEEIEDYMCNQEHVKQLKTSIQSNGGLIEPLIVRGGDNTVLEGNSRLAAYRLLNSKDPVKWGKVKCKVFPADLKEETIFRLLGQLHLIGKKDWEPFEQANYLYRRYKETKLPIESMAKELGLTKNKAKKMIEVIEFMKEHNDLEKKRWSYYEEYIKNASIKKYRDTSPEIDTVIAEQIKTGKIKEASDIRKLGEVAKVGDRQSKKIMKKVIAGSLDVYEAHQEIEASGKLDDIAKKIHKFKKLINDDTFIQQVINSENDIMGILYDIKKISKRLDVIKKDLEDNC